MVYGIDTDALIFWLAIVAIVTVAVFFTHRSRMAKYRMLETLAEKGQQISPELLAKIGNGGGSKEKNPVQSGIYLMCIGIALAVFFWALTGGGNPFMGEHVSWLPVIGIFPFMVGLARLLGSIGGRRND